MMWFLAVFNAGLAISAILTPTEFRVGMVAGAAITIGWAIIITEWRK